MDQKIRNQEEVATLPSQTKQQQREKNLDGLSQEEQQQRQAAIKEKRGTETQGGLQSKTNENQRGPYRQYEDANAILEKIRYYRTQ
jgi:hypothetical protein